MFKILNDNNQIMSYYIWQQRIRIRKKTPELYTVSIPSLFQNKSILLKFSIEWMRRLRGRTGVGNGHYDGCGGCDWNSRKWNQTQQVACNIHADRNFYYYLPSNAVTKRSSIEARPTMLVRYYAHTRWTLILTYVWPWLSIPGNSWSWTTHAKTPVQMPVGLKHRVKTNGRTLPIAFPSRVTWPKNSVGCKSSFPLSPPLSFPLAHPFPSLFPFPRGQTLSSHTEHVVLRP